MVAERSRPFVRGSITSDIEEAAAISAPQLRDAPAPEFPLLPPALDRLSTHFPPTTRTSICLQFRRTRHGRLGHGQQPSGTN